MRAYRSVFRGPYRRALLFSVALASSYVAIALVPLALSAARDLPQRPWYQDLGSGMAMAAFAMLLMEFVLAGRLRSLSRRLGMDITMRLHRFAGIAALSLLVIHPFLYGSMHSQPQPWDPLRARTVVLSNAALVTGGAALLLLCCLVALALFHSQLRWRYETWRLTHAGGALAVAGLGVHHTLDTGRYAQDPILAAFWIAAASVAALTIAKVYGLDPLLASRRSYRVSAVAREAERTWRMVLERPTPPRLRFAGGQFVWLRLGSAFARLAEHPFSIASAPAEAGRIQLLIKEAGDFTRAIGTVAAGTRAYFDGPYGNFTLEGREGDGIVLIAGGIGIAPILSILHELAQRGDRRPIKLLYGNRVAEQIAARSEIETLASRLRLETIYVLSEPDARWQGPRGVLDEGVLSTVVPRESPERWLYFVCGPVAMIDTVELALHRLGVPLAQIVSERFYYQGGTLTPRERLLRVAAGCAWGAIVLGCLVFALRP